MNEDLLKDLMEKAVQDEEFQRSLLANPEDVLTEMGFSPEEVAEIISALETGTSFEDLDSRISKYLFGGGGSG